MIQELTQANRLTHSEQRLLRRHGRAVLVIFVVHVLLCLLYLQFGFLALSGPQFLALFTVAGLLLALYLLALFTGRTLRFRDASLSLPLILASIPFFMASAYFVDEFRISAATLFFAVLLLVSFRLRGGQMFLVAVLASVAYAGMLWLAFANRGIHLSLTVEAMKWLVFTLVGFSFALTGSGINRLRTALVNTNHELEAVLEKVRDMAIRDDLTGLSNRRHLMEILQRQKALADSQGLPFAVCYVDLDHFKQVNDQFGHQWGDRVLKAFSEVAEEALRDSDFVGRLGGEEFLLVLPQSDCEGAVRVAERLRLAWRTQCFNEQGGPAQVSLSVGVAAYSGDESVDELIHRADQGLYQAKQQGRDQSQVA